MKIDLTPEELHALLLIIEQTMFYGTDEELEEIYGVNLNTLHEKLNNT